MLVVAISVAIAISYISHYIIHFLSWIDLNKISRLYGAMKKSKTQTLISMLFFNGEDGGLQGVSSGVFRHFQIFSDIFRGFLDKT